ncbi:MAG: hypothetical protein KDC34_00530 [Saprospiraceae bacterium]|nr:hypothetical protein [Saprospiraceae bacterium]
MSDLDQHMDDIIRDRLTDHDAGAPMHLWANIVQERKSKKRLGFLFFFKGGAVGLAILAVSWVLWANLSGKTLSPEPNSTPLNTDVEWTNTLSENIENIPVSADPAESSEMAIEEALSSQVVEQKSAVGNAALQSDESRQANNSLVDVLTPKSGFTTMPVSEESPEAAVEEEASAVSDVLLEPIPVYVPAPLETALAEGARPGSCVSFADPNWRTYVELYFSPDYAIRSLTAKSSEFGEYATLREKEAFQFAFTTGMRWNVVSPKGFGIRVGLQYAQIGELFTYTDPGAVQVNISNEYEDGVLISSDTTYVYGDSTFEIHNYYRTLDVPVMLGYEWEFQRMSFSVYGGIVANLWFGKKGKFLGPDLEQVLTFTDGDPNEYLAFKDNLSAHFAGSFGFHYQFAPNYYMLVEPHFRYFPNGITRDDYGLTQRYFVSGIALGLRYKW